MASSASTGIDPDQLESDGVTPRHGSALYATQEYWDYRFTPKDKGGGGDAHFEWLANWEAVEPIVRAAIPDKGARILLVGCGSSRLGADMCAAGYTNIIQSDYSAPCVRAMTELHRETCPTMQFAVVDVLQLEQDLVKAGLLAPAAAELGPVEATGGGASTGIDSAASSTAAAGSSTSRASSCAIFTADRRVDPREGLFDAVVDKAVMDALLAVKGDTWDPPLELLEIARTVCEGTVRALKPGGVFLQISFAQPHFRRFDRNSLAYT